MRHLITTASILVLLVAAFAGCAPRNSQGSFEELAHPERANAPQLNANQHERLGDDLLTKNSPEAAFLHYAQAQAMVPAGSEASDTLRSKKGLVMLSQGHDELALKEFQEVLESRPDLPLANEGAGAVYLKSGLNQEALAHLQRAVELDPGLWRSQQFLGVLASRAGDHAEAVRRFQLSLELRPGQPGTLNNLGVAHLMSGQYENALSAFREALAAGAPQDKTYNNIGLALARMGRDDEALETFRFAGTDAQAYNNLGYVLMLQQRTAEAVSYFERAIELSPSYYDKAFANLKQARLAASFHRSGIASAATGVPAQAAMAPVPTSTPGAPPETKAVAETELRPEAVSVSPTAAAVPAAVTAATGPTRFGLHLASFRKRARAETYMAALAEKKIQSLEVPVDLGEKGRWIRIMAGPYDSAQDAAKARPALLEALHLERAPIKKFRDRDNHTPPQVEGGPVL